MVTKLVAVGFGLELGQWLLTVFWVSVAVSLYGVVV